MAIDYELLNSSGEVNTFDWDAFLQDLADKLLDIALKLAYGIVILIVGLIIVSILLFILRRIIRRTKWEETLKRWLLAVVSALLKVILFTIVIGSIGIEVMSFTALIGAMGMAIGLALSGIVQNFMSGVMIIVLKLVKVGEWIRVSGVEGVVEETGIVFTKLVSFNRQAHFIPNSLIVNGIVTNYTRKDKRRIDLTFTISYREDIDRARDAVLAEIVSDERVLKAPRPLISVEDVDRGQIRLNVMPWIKTPDPFQYMGILWDMNRHILEGIQKSDLSVGLGVYDSIYHFGPQPPAPKPQDRPIEELTAALTISDNESENEEEEKKKKSFTNLIHRKHKKIEDEGETPEPEDDDEKDDEDTTDSTDSEDEEEKKKEEERKKKEEKKKEEEKSLHSHSKSHSKGHHSSHSKSKSKSKNDGVEMDQM